MLEQGKSYTEIQQKLRVSPSRISILKKQLKITPVGHESSGAATTSTTTQSRSLSVAEIVQLGKNKEFAISESSGAPERDTSRATTFLAECCVCGEQIFEGDIAYLDSVGGVNWYICSQECCIKYYRKRHNAIPVFD